MCRAALTYLSHVMYNSVKISNIINKGLVKLYRELNLTGKRLGGYDCILVYWAHEFSRAASTTVTRTYKVAFHGSCLHEEFREPGEIFCEISCVVLSVSQ